LLNLNLFLPHSSPLLQFHTSIAILFVLLPLLFQIEFSFHSSYSFVSIFFSTYILIFFKKSFDKIISFCPHSSGFSIGVYSGTIELCSTQRRF
jgi:hypothetical protein